MNGKEFLKVKMESRGQYRPMISKFYEQKNSVIIPNIKSYTQINYHKSVRTEKMSASAMKGTRT